MTGWIGYEPRRLTELRRRAVEAVDDLRGIMSADPSAIAALQAVRLAREHLEQGLLRHVDAILASDAMATWRSSGLSAWSASNALGDGELLDEFDDILNRLWASLNYGFVDIDDPWARLVAVLDELSVRAATDASFLDQLAGDGSELLLERLAGLLDSWASAPVPPPPAALRAAAELLAVAATDDGIAASLGELAFHSPVLGHLLPWATFPRPVMVAIAAGVLRRAGLAIDPPSTREATIAADDTIRALCVDPDAALDLLQNGESVEQLLTLRLDQELVERLSGLGLGTAVQQDPSRLGAGLAALANVIAVADGSAIGPGGARGVAAALGVHLPRFTDLGRGRDVLVSSGTDDPGTADTVRLGSYEEVENLMQALVGDEQAQLTLSVIGREHTTSTLLEAAAGLPNPVSEELANDRLAGALVPHAEFLGMVLGAIDRENSARAAARAALISGAGETIRTAGSIAGFLPVPLVQGASQAASPAANILEWLAAQRDPEPVPDTGIVELANMDLDFDLVELAARDPELARAYALTPTARRVIGDYAARYRGAVDIGTKADLHSQMRTYLRDLPGESLHSAQNVIAAASGFDD